MDKLKKLKADLVALLTQVRDISAKAESENRDFTAEERAEVQKHLDAAAPIKDQIKAAQGDSELRKAIADLGDSVGLVPEDQPKPQAGTLASKGSSLGERFVHSPDFKAWMEKVAPNGQIAETAKGLQSPPLGFKGLRELGRKALITGGSDTSAGALVVPQDLGLRDQGVFQRPLTIRDIITIGQTDSDLVQYVRITGFTNAAAPTAEATAATGTSGTKPESGLTMERIDAPVKTVAHWIPATKRALSDASQLRTLIDQFLDYGLEEALEDQIVTGDNTGENFEGITTVSGVQSQAWDTDIFVTTRKARTKVVTVGRARPTAYLLHPNDWERFDLARSDGGGGAGTGPFLGTGPFGEGLSRLWRLPVVESEAVPEGTGYVGDFRTCVLWDREQASIQVSDSHEDFFVRNLVAILAELRAAFGIFRPEALVEMDLTA